MDGGMVGRQGRPGTGRHRQCPCLLFCSFCSFYFYFYFYFLFFYFLPFGTDTNGGDLQLTVVRGLSDGQRALVGTRGTKCRDGMDGRSTVNEHARIGLDDGGGNGGLVRRKGTAL
jgi:hypothetical protein